MRKFPKPLDSASDTTKKIMMVPCMVTRLM
jgi:hypothetical protein